MIWKGIVKWKKTIRFALTGSHSVSGVVNFAAGTVFYFTTDKPRSRGRIEKLLLAQRTLSTPLSRLWSPFELSLAGAYPLRSYSCLTLYILLYTIIITIIS
jgi:hypothetical protein